ncbi:DNA adenine methylase [Brachyspira innocens]|uniref:DNA adenine methylase n=1 Tax=Brachyspira innocens TaxID=13264 RepID=UPI000375AD5E|nr:Dam family site-specific DNA-(adenine-N6)-methyltransferase [Brachyspira innocens]
MPKSNIFFVKSPLNYIGGKYKILNQILPIFPNDINNFIDLFTGGGNVAVNVKAQKIFMNDNLIYLIDLYKLFYELRYNKILEYIYNRIEEYKLSDDNADGYNKLRDEYNTNRKPLDLFVLVSYSFNHQIRFNNNHQFNNPFGKYRSSFNNSIKNNLENFIHRMQSLNIDFSNDNFESFNFDFLKENDFIYCDPPYLISTGTYNDGKRGFTGWNKDNEIMLLNILDNLNKRNIKFALSNLLIHNGQINSILKEWISYNNYNIKKIDSNYNNSCYNKKILAQTKTIEVLVTNYKTDWEGIDINTNDRNLFFNMEI